MNIRFLEKIAKKSPAFARLLEYFIYGSGSEITMQLLLVVVRFLELGEAEELIEGIKGIVVVLVTSTLGAKGKMQRDLQKSK